jgi:hypothetical protein
MHKILKVTLLVVGIASVAQSANVVKKTIPIKLFSQMMAPSDAKVVEVAKPKENLAEAEAGCVQCGGNCIDKTICWDSDSRPGVDVDICATVTGCSGHAH